MRPQAIGRGHTDLRLVVFPDAVYATSPYARNDAGWEEGLISCGVRSLLREPQPDALIRSGDEQLIGARFQRRDIEMTTL